MSDNLETPHLSNEFIDYHALGMVKHLQTAGHTAYLVGGCVRDLLVGHTPKDFDIGTTALPQEVKKLINFSFIIGKRFRLVLVKRWEKQYEVATFRREAQKDEVSEDAPFGDNIFGTPEQDAKRRDFTCNGLFYDPVAEEVIDFVNGQKDIQDHIIRMIGDPKIRLAEDPIRILRALRFAHKLHFQIEPELRAEMATQAFTLPNSVLPRRREEYLKLLRLPNPAHVFCEGYDLKFWDHTLPTFAPIYQSHESLEIFEERMHRLQERLIDPSDTAFLFGCVLLGWLRAQHLDKDIDFYQLRNNEVWKKLAKEELGLHNWELSNIERALKLQRILANPEGFMRKGRRRKSAVLQADIFPLAVDLAFVDGYLEKEVIDFWDTQLEETLKERG